MEKKKFIPKSSTDSLNTLSHFCRLEIDLHTAFNKVQKLQTQKSIIAIEIRNTFDNLVVRNVGEPHLSKSGDTSSRTRKPPEKFAELSLPPAILVKKIVTSAA